METLSGVNPCPRKSRDKAIMAGHFASPQSIEDARTWQNDFLGIYLTKL